VCPALFFYFFFLEEKTIGVIFFMRVWIPREGDKEPLPDDARVLALGDDFHIDKEGTCVWWEHADGIECHLDMCELGRSSWTQLLAFMEKMVDGEQRCRLHVRRVSLTTAGVGCLADAAMVPRMRGLVIENVATEDTAEAMHRLFDAVASPTSSVAHLDIRLPGHSMTRILNRAASLVAMDSRMQSLRLQGSVKPDGLAALRRLWEAMRSTHILEHASVSGRYVADTAVTDDDICRALDASKNGFLGLVDNVSNAQTFAYGGGFKVGMDRIPHKNVYLRGGCFGGFDIDAYECSFGRYCKSLSRIWKPLKICDNGSAVYMASTLRISPAEFRFDMEQICAYAVRIAPRAEVIVIG
jgi:hypothetical protein